MESVNAELQEMGQVEQQEKLIEANKKLKSIVDNVYRLKEESSRSEKKFKEAKAELAKIMEDGEIDRVDGSFCTCSGKTKSNVGVPKDLKDKKELFDYIKKEEGPEVLMEMITINARSFTSWYNAEIQKHVDNGELDFKLEMLKPYDTFSLGFRKKSNK